MFQLLHVGDMTFWLNRITWRDSKLCRHLKFFVYCMFDDNCERDHHLYRRRRFLSLIEIIHALSADVGVNSHLRCSMSHLDDSLAWLDTLYLCDIYYFIIMRFIVGTRKSKLNLYVELKFLWANIWLASHSFEDKYYCEWYNDGSERWEYWRRRL